jgi:hypothetical protein
MSQPIKKAQTGPLNIAKSKTNPLQHKQEVNLTTHQAKPQAAKAINTTKNDLKAHQQAGQQIQNAAGSRGKLPFDAKTNKNGPSNVEQAYKLNKNTNKLLKEGKSFTKSIEGTKVSKIIDNNRAVQKAKALYAQGSATLKSGLANNVKALKVRHSGKLKSLYRTTDHLAKKLTRKFGGKKLTSAYTSFKANNRTAGQAYKTASKGLENVVNMKNGRLSDVKFIHKFSDKLAKKLVRKIGGKKLVSVYTKSKRVGQGISKAVELGGDLLKKNIRSVQKMDAKATRPVDQALRTVAPKTMHKVSKITAVASKKLAPILSKGSALTGQAVRAVVPAKAYNFIAKPVSAYVAKSGGRFVAGMNVAIAGMDVYEAYKTVRDPKASFNKKALSCFTAAASVTAATNIPIVSQAGAVLSVVGNIGGMFIK